MFPQHSAVEGTATPNRASPPHRNLVLPLSPPSWWKWTSPCETSARPHTFEGPGRWKHNSISNERKRTACHGTVRRAMSRLASLLFPCLSSPEVYLLHASGEWWSTAPVWGKPSSVFYRLLSTLECILFSSSILYRWTKNWIDTILDILDIYVTHRIFVKSQRIKHEGGRGWRADHVRYFDISIYPTCDIAIYQDFRYDITMISNTIIDTASQ